MAARRTVQCPSATCDEGALLLGRVTGAEVAFASRPVRLDAALASGLRAQGGAERAFRFAAPCAKGGCGQWASGRCGVIDRIVDAPQAEPVPPALPDCLIRDACRWFLQRGPAACALCRYVVTDNTEVAAHPAM